MRLPLVERTMESGRKIGKNSRKDLIDIHTKKEQFFTLPPLSSFAPVANTAKRSKKAPLVAGSSVVLRIARFFVLFAGILASEPLQLFPAPAPKKSPQSAANNNGGKIDH